MKNDLQIAQECNMKHIEDIAQKIGISKDYVECYGKYKAKISDEYYNEVSNNKNGKLILVTAINPTPAGEGKTTITIGLSEALNKIDKKTIVVLREPSLGPCFGVKGGAAGGGYSQVVPMEDINLHFTGDIHAITTANNLLSAMIDNHIQQGNECNIDVRRIVWKRVLDMNDRALRNIVIGLGGNLNGVPREDSFQITVASEIMAILCLAEDIIDLKEKLGNIIIGYNFDDLPVTAKDIGADGAMTVLLKDAIKPNLVQTLNNNPAIIHGGPFANIAHGCNSIRATKLALKLSDYVVTEAGFGADLGAEKFFDIKCRKANLNPDVVVIVATIKALKYNAFIEKSDLNKENVDAVKKGIVNLEKHIENLKKYNIPIVVTLNNFVLDTEAEIDVVRKFCKKIDVKFSIAKVWEKGADGGIELANEVIKAIEENKSKFKLLYDDSLSIKEKINKVCNEIYGAKNILFSKKSLKTLEKIKKMNLEHFPICIAKTQYSFSDNPNLLGKPTDFDVTVQELRISAGAGFIVVILGDIMTMPGLPKKPAAFNIDIDSKGNVIGLF